MSGPESWQNFFVMLGGAAAALTGLVLVAVSLHVNTILRHPLHRDRAFASLQGLVTALLIALAALVPQPPSAFGIELLLVGVFWLFRYARFIRLYRGIRTQHRAALRAPEWVLWAVWIFALIAGGILLLAGDVSAYYVLAAAIAIGITIIVWNVWVLMADAQA